MTQLLLPLSDDQVLPMNAATYAHEIRGIVDDFDETYHSHLSKKGISLSKSISSAYLYTVMTQCLPERSISVRKMYF